MKTLLLALLVCTLSFSCSQGGKTQSTLNITVGSLAAPNLSTYQVGGAMLYGFNRNNNEKFAINLIDANEGLEIELANGEWTFYGFLWDGAMAFNGTNYCSYLNTNLSGGEAQLDIRFSADNCNNSKFTSFGVNQFPELEIESCRSLPTTVTFGLTCNDTNEREGFFRSFKITLETYNGGLAVNEGSSINSGCFDATAGAMNGTGIKLPQGDGSLPLKIGVEAFYDLGCTGPKGSIKRTYDFGMPANGSSAKGAEFRTSGGPDTSKIFHVVTASDICNNSSADTSTDFSSGNGTVGFPYGICTPEQWNLIGAAGSTLAENFELLNHLDFSSRMAGIDTGAINVLDPQCFGFGTNIKPVGPGFYSSVCTGSADYNTLTGGDIFTGNFNGNHYSINNAVIFAPEDAEKVALFRQMGSGEIKNLNINNLRVEGKTDVAALVGSAVSSSGLITISNIKMKDSTIEVRSGSRVGNLIGQATASSNNMIIEDIIAINSLIDVEGGQVGGIIGYPSANGGQVLDIDRLYFEGKIYVEPNSPGVFSNFIGGLFGGANSAGTINIDDVTTKGHLSGSLSQSGGLSGTFNNTGTVNINNASSHMAISSTYDNNGAVELGGLVGSNDNSNLNINNAFFTGSIYTACRAATLTDCKVGSLIGDGTNAPTSTANTYSDSALGLGGLHEGTFITLANMRVNASFDTPQLSANWLTVENRYPRLAWLDNHEYTRNDCDFNASNNLPLTTQASNGRGIESNPITLCHPEQWGNDLSSIGNSYVVMKDDLNIGERAVNPSLPNQVTSFSGTLDGKDHILHGHRMSGVMNTVPTLIDNNLGTIKNLYFNNFSQTLGSGVTRAGSLINTNSGTISKVTASHILLEASAGFDQSYMGGLVISNDGVISESSVFGVGIVALDGADSVGGIVGINNGELEKTFFYGRISLSGAANDYNDIGGIVGSSIGGVIDQVSWGGEIKVNPANTNNSFNIGGIIGNAADTDISNVMTDSHSRIATGKSRYVGGLVGRLDSSSLLEKSYNGTEILFKYCSDPTYMDELDCVNNSFTWIDPGTESDIGPIVGSINGGATLSSDVFYTNRAYSLAQINVTASSATHSGSTCTITLSAVLDRGPADIMASMSAPGQHAIFVEEHNNFYPVTAVTTADSVFTIESDVNLCGDINSGNSMTVVKMTSNTDGVGKTILEMSDQQTFCPSAPASLSDSSYRCPASEWDIVEDATPTPSPGNGFEYIIEYYRAAIFGNVENVDNPPIWRVEPDENRGPELLQLRH